uniref:Putative calcineurin-like phosphoesterase n=1 Tax=viral metagenome TaxID=1070528 RepID=A0A6M3KBB3_9ZZZZ
MALRLFSFGDIHYNTFCLSRVITFIKKAVSQSKCDIVVHSGDICSSSADANPSQLSDVKNNYFDALGVPYYVVPGNHDVVGSTCTSGCSNHVGAAITCNYRSVYGNPNWLKTFSKDGITYQLIGVSICPDSSVSYYWIFDFGQSGISTTRPTIVLNHGPIVIPADTSCGSWTSDVYKYAVTQNLKAKLDALNTLISYTGHVHAPRQTVLNNRFYISENTISSDNERCLEDTTRFIGYTKITPNTNGTFQVQYQVIRYMNPDGTVPAFVDPFPDSGTPVPTPSGTAISNIVALTGTVYTQDDLMLGKNMYVDRVYTFKSIMLPFTGFKYILTGNDERYYTDAGFLKFNLDRPSIVYIAYDNRITVKPAWLTSAFTDTNFDMIRDDGILFSIFEKSYPAGQVSLGGCSIPTGGAGGMYSVFIKLSDVVPTPTPTPTLIPTKFPVNINSYPSNANVVVI